MLAADDLTKKLKKYETAKWPPRHQLRWRRCSNLLSLSYKCWLAILFFLLLLFHWTRHDWFTWWLQNLPKRPTPPPPIKYLPPSPMLWWYIEWPVAATTWPSLVGGYRSIVVVVLDKPQSDIWGEFEKQILVELTCTSVE